MSSLQKYLGLFDNAAFILAIWFAYSVIANARTLIEDGVKDAPASPALIIAVILLLVCGLKRKRLTTLNVIALTMIATAGAVWVFGLTAQADYLRGGFRP